MRRFTSLIAVLLLAQLPTRSAELTKEQVAEMRSLFQAARTAYQEKEYAKSTESLTKLLKLLPASEGTQVDPNAARIHYDIACNHAQLEKKDEAFANLTQAVAKGFWDHRFMERDSTLKGLHADKRFAAVLEESRKGVGKAAFGLKDIHGKVVQEKDFAGKVLVLDIWGTWCPPCRKEIPHFVKLQKEYGKQGLAVIGLTWERRPADEAIRKRVVQFAKDNNVNYTLVMLPPSVLQSIPGVQAFPTTLYVGRDGLLAERKTGAEGYPQIEARVLPLLKKKAPGK